ncbi:MAG: YdcF family protein [Oscillospiraceae bacterium]|nr:YdcF family protein [Oscillospiraceae bacterium]
MKIVRIIITIAGALLLLNVFFVPRVTIGWYVQLGLSLAILAYAALFTKIPKWAHITALVLAMLPALFTGFLAIYGNTSNVTHTEDAVIVLGAGIRGENPSRLLAYRLNTAIAYHQRNPEAYIVVTGGYGEGQQFSEAHVMQRWLVLHGVPVERIVQENRSISTEENLLFAHEILQAQFERDDFTVVVVTSDFHLYRGMMLARQTGFDATRLGALVPWYTWPMNYLRELLAVVNAWVGNPLTRHTIAM